jgi:hypothetical protein
MTDWLVLQLIRNRKSRREFFASSEDFNDRFISEFEKEVIISRTRYPYVDRAGRQVGGPAASLALS